MPKTPHSEKRATSRSKDLPASAEIALRDAKIARETIRKLQIRGVESDHPISKFIEEVDILDATLRQLDQLQIQFPDDPSIALETVKGHHDASAKWRVLSKSGRPHPMVHDFRALGTAARVRFFAAKFADDLEITLTCAAHEILDFQGWSSQLAIARKRGNAWERMDDARQWFYQLYRRFPADPRMARLADEFDKAELNANKVASETISQDTEFAPGTRGEDAPQQFGPGIEEFLPGAHDATDSRAGLREFFRSRGVPENEMDDACAQAERIAVRAKIRAIPIWDKRPNELRYLTAPAYLRAMYGDLLEAGRLRHEDLVREHDPELIRLIQQYISQRTRRNAADLGDAEGISFERKDARGRPSRARKRPMLRRSRGVTPC
jgi:hypothetical protein